MESLTQEKDNLVQMATIKSSKDQALTAGVLNPSKGKNKAKDSKQQDKKKQDRPKFPDGDSNPYKDLNPHLQIWVCLVSSCMDASNTWIYSCPWMDSKLLQQDLGIFYT